MTTKYLLGIDAGGSKCHAALWSLADRSGLGGQAAAMLAAAAWQTKIPGINLDVIGHDLATARWDEIVQTAAAAVGLSAADLLAQTQIVLGMPGLDTALDFQVAQQWLNTNLAPYPNTNWHLITDVELALWSANSQGTGILLIAGTGSNCFGRTAQGLTAKAGGLSHFFADEGGGFMLGWQALHIMGKMADGRLAPDALWSALLAKYQVSDFAALKQQITHAADYKRLVAQAAPVVQELAAQGHPLCHPIVQDAIDDLVLMADTVARQLHTHTLPVYLVGGLWADAYYRQQLLVRLETVSLHGNTAPITTPVVGALAYQLSFH